MSKTLAGLATGLCAAAALVAACVAGVCLLAPPVRDAQTGLLALVASGAFTIVAIGLCPSDE